MIQRIQSVFLFIAFVAFGLMFFFPIAFKFPDADGTNLVSYQLYNYYLQVASPGSEPLMNYIITLPMAVTTGLAGLLSLITIFVYKNRLKQMNLVKLCVFINILLVVGIFFWYSGVVEEKAGTEPSYDIAAYFPLITLVFLILAFRRIRKDEKMVRAAERLR